MKSIRENSPIFVGWLVYNVYQLAQSGILGIGITWLLLRFSSQPSVLVTLILSVSIFVVSGYLSFVASAKWIVFPWVRRHNSLVELPDKESLFIEWLMFSFVLLIFGSLPLFLVRAVSPTKEIEDVISFIWKALVSFSCYRGVLASTTISTKTDESMKEDKMPAQIV